LESGGKKIPRRDAKTLRGITSKDVPSAPQRLCGRIKIMFLVNRYFFLKSLTRICENYSGSSSQRKIIFIPLLENDVNIITMN